MTSPPEHGSHRRRGSTLADDRESESEADRLDRNWGELLQELRITQTGLQLLSGFLLTLPFTRVFGSLDEAQEWLYLSLVVIAGVGVGANMAPVMLHRRVFRERVKDRVVRVGHLMVQVVVAAIAVLVVGMTVLTFSVVVSWPAGVVAGLLLAAVLGALLLGPASTRPALTPCTGCPGSCRWQTAG